MRYICFIIIVVVVIVIVVVVSSSSSAQPRLPASHSPPASAPQALGITGVSYEPWLDFLQLSCKFSIFRAFYLDASFFKYFIETWTITPAVLSSFLPSHHDKCFKVCPVEWDTHSLKSCFGITGLSCPWPIGSAHFGCVCVGASRETNWGMSTASSLLVGRIKRASEAIWAPPLPFLFFQICWDRSGQLPDPTSSPPVRAVRTDSGQNKPVWSCFLSGISL